MTYNTIDKVLSELVNRGAPDIVKRYKAYSLMETNISKTWIMTSQKGGFVRFSKQQQNHDSKNWKKRLLSNKTSLHTEQPPPPPFLSFPSTLRARNMYI